jgi:hypothetical protein
METGFYEYRTIPKLSKKKIKLFPNVMLQNFYN